MDSNTIFSAFATTMSQSNFDPDCHYIGTFDSKEKAIDAILGEIEKGYEYINEGSDEPMIFDLDVVLHELFKTGGYTFLLSDLFYEVVERKLNSVIE